MRKEAEIGESVQPSETIDAHSGEIPSLRQQLRELKANLEVLV